MFWFDKFFLVETCYCYYCYNKLPTRWSFDSDVYCKIVNDLDIIAWIPYVYI